MADKEHVRRLREGVVAWNAWRAANRDLRPDLSQASLNKLSLFAPGPNKKAPGQYVADWGFVDGSKGIDLRAAILTGADLSQSRLLAADFSDADLVGANLAEVDARGACFARARLENATFDGATLDGADFSGANLDHASLNVARLYKADFSQAKALRSSFVRALVSSARFHRANLVSASFVKARLVEAYFDDAQMFFSDLRQAVAKEASFRRANLDYAHLEGALLDGASFEKASLKDAMIRSASLVHADLDECNLAGANLSAISGQELTLRNAILHKAILQDADLRGATIHRADLREADLAKANLSEASLRGSVLMRASLRDADLTNCKVYGISAWDVDLEGATQRDLVFTPKGEPVATIDDLEVAQFVHLLSQNQKIRRLLDTVTQKVVLILGRFSAPRMRVLQAIRNELRQLGYLPLLFTFDPSGSRNLTETVATLASLVRFVIADITDPKSVPQELEVIASRFLSVPIQPIIAGRQEPYALFESVRERQSVLPLFRYQALRGLCRSFKARVVVPAERLADQIISRRRGQTNRRLSKRRQAAKV